MKKRIFVVLLLALLVLLMLALSYCRHDSGHVVTETFTVDNLIANTSIKDNGLTASTIVTNDGTKVLQSYAGSGCGPGSAIGALSAAGGATCVVAGGTTGALSIARVAQPGGTVDVSTSGTMDWHVTHTSSGCGAATQPHTCTVGGGQTHDKIGNQMALLTWSINYAGQANFNITNVSHGQSISTTATEDQIGALASTNAAWAMICNGANCHGNNTNWGYGFAEICDGHTHVEHIYGTTVGAVVRYSAHLSDESAPDVHYDSDTGNSTTTNDDEIKITYNCSVGGLLMIRVSEITSYSPAVANVNPALYFMASWAADS